MDRELAKRTILDVCHDLIARGIYPGAKAIRNATGYGFAHICALRLELIEAGELVYPPGIKRCHLPTAARKIAAKEEHRARYRICHRLKRKYHGDIPETVLAAALPM